VGLRSHVHEHNATLLDGRVRGDADLFLEIGLRWLVRHVHARAAGVEFPAVIDTPQATLLIPAEEQGRAAVRAVVGDDTHATATLAERNQVLAQQTDADWRTVGLGQLLGEECRQPVLAEYAAPRSTWSYTRQ
jgi:hypothetical protein